MFWTKEQLEAINITNINTTVSASAGAGKTAVLVERLMKRILKDNVSVDEIVSLTFTDAAAAEMKNRLMKSLLDAYAKDPNNEYLNEQITLLPSANISTIHSFCLSILKDYYYVLGLNPEALNNIIDEADLLLIHSEAFSYTLSNYDKDKIASLINFLTTANLGINDLNDIIKDLLNEANNTINPTKFLYDSISVYTSYTSLKDLKEPFRALFFNELLNFTKNLKSAAFEALYLLDTVDLDVESQRQWLNFIVDNIENLQKSLKNFEYTNFLTALETIMDYENKTVSKFPEYTVLRSNIYNLYTEMSDILYSEEELLKQLSSNEEVLTYLVDLCIIYNDYYKKAIKKLNKITFSDMETLTYEVLSANDNEVAKEIRETITDILVDEYQDTNELQDEIIRLISNGNNIFRVGDVKQSIYRFRGAKPSIMQELISQEDSLHHKTIYLSNNFRSKSHIVEYNNHFFKHLMNVENFNSAYLENDIVEAGSDNQFKNSEPVEIHLVNTDNENYDTDILELSNNDIQATYIASKIIELYNEANDDRWNRFTVLVNSHSRKLDLKKAFDKANIPYFISLPDGLYNSKAVSVLTSYLKLVHNPKDSISLMAVLVNLYNYSDDEITREFLKYNNLFDVANALDANILKEINQYHLKQNGVKISDIANYVLSINNFYELKISKQERVNMDIFYKKILNYEEEHLGIYGLLKIIELEKDAKAQEGSSISSEDNVVNVMTVHNSKGLQFETVFFMSKTYKRSAKGQKAYLIHPTLGLAIKSVDTNKQARFNNIANYTIENYEKQEAIEEEMRKLYVALTRAQNELYIVDKAKLTDDYEDKIAEFDHSLVKSQTYTKWIESLHYAKPSEYEKYVLEDELKIVIGSPLEISTKSITKLPEVFLSIDNTRNHFKAKKLSFESDTLGVSIGSLVHKTIEQLDLYNINKGAILKVSPDLSNYYIDKILKLNDNDFFNDLLKHDLHQEYPFIANLDGTRHRGIIDLLVIAENEMFIIDFKTDSFEKESDFIKSYSSQLNFYQKALELKFNQFSISKFIYSFKLDKFIEIKDNIV